MADRPGCQQSGQAAVERQARRPEPTVEVARQAEFKTVKPLCTQVKSEDSGDQKVADRDLRQAVVAESPSDQTPDRDGRRPRLSIAGNQPGRDPCFTARATIA